MRELTPDDYKECPLGLVGCSKFDEQNEYGRRMWKKCSNYNYCKGVCEAWYLPFEIDDDGMVVRLDLPYNYDEETFAKEMSQYGWAEAQELPYHRGEHLDFYTVGDELLVIRNEFFSGFAVAIDIERRIYIQRYVIDEYGWWWFPGGNGKPPQIQTRKT